MSNKRKNAKFLLNQNIKAYFIDLDGTLLDSKDSRGKVPSQVNIEAIKYAKKQGKKIIISTGRSFKKAFKILEIIDADYIVTLNGAQIHDKKGKLLKESVLPFEIAESILLMAKQNRVLFYLSNTDELYGANNFLKKWIVRFLGYIPYKGYKSNFNENIYKIVLIGKSSKLKNITKKLEQYKNEITWSYQRKFLEVTLKTASKGTGARFLIKKMNLQIDETVHIGDTGNDISTLNNVGALIAMANSSKDLIDVATYIGPHYKNGGVAKIISGEFLKNKKGKLSK